jgi:predicted Rossmann fold nucleotide-binding protein DprA/Smf involved in DNA uptake
MNKVAVIGSRYFEDFDRAALILDRFSVGEVVSGGAAGADSVAEKYAESRGLPMKVFLPRFKTDPGVPYHPKWFFERNRQIVDYADFVVAFWDMKSNGTRYTLEYARKVGKETHVFRLKGEK